MLEKNTQWNIDLKAPSQTLESQSRSPKVTNATGDTSLPPQAHSQGSQSAGEGEGENKCAHSACCPAPPHPSASHARGHHPRLLSGLTELLLTPRPTVRPGSRWADASVTHTPAPKRGSSIFSDHVPAPRGQQGSANAVSRGCKETGVTPSRCARYLCFCWCGCRVRSWKFCC